jgi:hypothetical protein
MIVHAVLVAYQNTERTLQRWTRDVRPSLQVCFKDQWRVTCVDNSPEYSRELCDAFDGPGGYDPGSYFWNQGLNEMYGGAINLAVRRVPSDFVIYVCTNHGRMVDPRWTWDMVAPMIADPRVAPTGYLLGSNSPEGVAHWAWPGPENKARRREFEDRFRFVKDDGTGHVPQHIQGGVFAARTGALWERPYVDPFMHLYSDHYLTWSLLKAGYEVRNVNSVMSVWKSLISNLSNLKYYHDDSEGP